MYAINVDFSETGSGVVFWIQLSQNMGEWQITANTVMELQVP